MAAVKDYSVEEKLSSLVKLQKVDSKLDEIKILKGELPMEVSDLEDEITGLNSRKNRVEEEINGITEFIEQKRTAIKDADALVKKYEKQSESVKNSREFEAINKEMEMQQSHLWCYLSYSHVNSAITFGMLPNITIVQHPSKFSGMGMKTSRVRNYV